MPLNHDSKGIINKQLYKLKKYSLHENKGNHKDIEKLAKYVAKIHAQNISQEKFEIYNAEWIIEQVYKIEDNQYKKDIILALKTMSQIEGHNAPPKAIKKLAWDIIQSNWQKDYKSGRVGSHTWDIACIINFANDSQFSDVFLKSYLKHGGEKPSLVALYANLYYVKVVEGVKSGDFEDVIKGTREIIENAMFKTDIISYDTLIEFGIIGY